MGDGVTELDRTHNLLSYWFPMLVKRGAPVPKTSIVKTPGEWWKLLMACEGQKPPQWDELIPAIKSACDEMGYPCFLRSGQCSAKHDWRESCFIESPDTNIGHHVAAIVEYSEMADWSDGLSYDEWAIREFLRVPAPFTAFRGMPVTKERRYFVRDGKVEHHQPYWPPDSIINPSVENWRPLLDELNHESEREIDELTAMTEHFAPPGFWSMDWFWVPDRGWVVTDMALGEMSFRWDPQ